MDYRVTLNLNKEALAFLKENNMSLDAYIKDKFYVDREYGVRVVSIKKHAPKYMPNDNVRFWFRHDVFDELKDIVALNIGKAFDDVVAVTHCFLELNGNITYGCAVCKYPDKMSKKHGRAVAMKIAKRMKPNSKINKTFISREEKNDFFHNFCNKNVIFINMKEDDTFDAERMVH